LTECQKYAWTKLPDVCQYEGKKKPSWDKTKTIFLSVWRQKKKQQPKNKVKHIYVRHYRIRIDHKV
jgi:hypothetical protein